MATCAEGKNSIGSTQRIMDEKILKYSFIMP